MPDDHILNMAFYRNINISHFLMNFFDNYEDKVNDPNDISDTNYVLRSSMNTQLFIFRYVELSVRTQYDSHTTPVWFSNAILLSAY